MSLRPVHPWISLPRGMQGSKRSGIMNQSANSKRTFTEAIPTKHMDISTRVWDYILLRMTLPVILSNLKTCSEAYILIS